MFNFSKVETHFWVCRATFYSMEEALRQQTIGRLQKKQQSASDEVSGGDSSSAPPPERSQSSASIHSSESSQPPPTVAPPIAEIELVFKPYPGQSGSGSISDTRYIKTTINATSKH